MTTPIPSAAIDASAPTSRATFRLIARCVDATNRDADTLRHALLAQWAERSSTYELVRRLQVLDPSDPDGAQGVDARLAVWFSYSDSSDEKIVADDDPVLNGLSDELRARLSDVSAPAND